MNKDKSIACITGDVMKMIDVITTSLLIKGQINYQEKEDFRHDLILFFLESCVDFANERELVFISLKNTSLNLIKYNSYRAHSSLDCLPNADDLFFDNNLTLNKMEETIDINNVLSKAKDIDLILCQEILNDMTIDQISCKYKISKKTIYRRLKDLNKK